MHTGEYFDRASAPTFDAQAEQPVRRDLLRPTGPYPRDKPRRDGGDGRGVMVYQDSGGRALAQPYASLGGHVGSPGDVVRK